MIMKLEMSLSSPKCNSRDLLQMICSAPPGPVQELREDGRALGEAAAERSKGDQEGGGAAAEAGSAVHPRTAQRVSAGRQLGRKTRQKLILLESVQKMSGCPLFENMLLFESKLGCFFKLDVSLGERIFSGQKNERC